MKPIAHATLTSRSGYTQAIDVRGHKLAADEPVASGGADAGPTPYELVLAGLGACTAITLRMYAQRKGWELGEVRVNLTILKEEHAAQIERDVRFSAPLTDEQRARLAEIAEKTPVTKTIRAGAPIRTRFPQE
jgi:putative redox protein